MLSYNPDHEGALYLFDDPGRKNAPSQLTQDIPYLVEDNGDVIQVRAFYESIYNATPAHMDDIHTAIIENPDLVVVTPAGGTRQKTSTIEVGYTLRLRRQRNFFPMFKAPRKR